MLFEFYITIEENMFKNLSSPYVNKDADSEIVISTNKKYQVIDGWGASFTDSSAFLIDKCLTEEQKNEVMKLLFDRQEGIGLSILRNPMGASDYSRNIYSYDDMNTNETDPQLEHFSIEHDEESIIPLTKHALKLNEHLKIFASPWSPPGWMKDSNHMIGGKLLPKYYEVYANYFKKMIKSYQLHGLDIYAVTPQNEPLYLPEHYPGMEMLADEQAIFVSEFLKPIFIKNGISTKIYGYDHNWDRIDYPLELLDKAEDSFDGIAWHWYGGDVRNQSRVATFFPTKEIHFTEGSGGDWIPAFEPAFSNLMRTGIEILRNGANSMTLWNIALDEKNGPTVPGFGKSTCRGLIEINRETNLYTLTLDYYGLAHFSKFVKANAIRIESSQEKSIKSVAFENIDDSVVVVLFNDGEKNRHTSLNIDGTKTGVFCLPDKSAVTVYAKY